MRTKFYRHMMDIKNDYIDKDRLEDIGEIIIEHDEDEDADRHLIDMVLQLSQQKANNRTKYNYKLSTQLDSYNRKYEPQVSQYSKFLTPKYFHHPPQQISMQCI